MSKQTKTTLCRNCHAPLPEGAKVCPSCGAKNKKPFYKRGWFILLVIVVVIVAAVKFANRTPREKIVWDDMTLGTMLPKPKSRVGMIWSNSQDSLSLDVYNTSQGEYNDYVKACQEQGFTEESESSERHYTAFNADGYELNLSYLDEEMDIQLEAPIEMETIVWPASEIAAWLPVPVSTTGKIERESSEGLLAYIGNTSPEDYDAYVAACSAKGFTVDYEKTDNTYSADNDAGYHLSVRYEGNQVMRIEIGAPIEEPAESPAPTPTATAEPTPTPAASDSTAADSTAATGIRPEFQQAMDSYEAFMDEYCAFMEKYSASDGSDMSLLSDYADYMSQYADMMEDFEAWDNEEMTTEETLYYIEVQARVSQKLAEASA